MGEWKRIPDSPLPSALYTFKIESFVVRVGEWDMLVDCDDPLAVHKLCSTFPAFEFQARPVIAVDDTVRVELEAIAWRDGLKG